MPSSENPAPVLVLQRVAVCCIVLQCLAVVVPPIENPAPIHGYLYMSMCIRIRILNTYMHVCNIARGPIEEQCSLQ